jgi:hypothetical protein
MLGEHARVEIAHGIFCVSIIETIFVMKEFLEQKTITLTILGVGLGC